MSQRRTRNPAARAPSARLRRAGQNSLAALLRPQRDVLAEARAVTERTRQLRAHSEALVAAQREVTEANRRFVDLYDFVPIPYLIVSSLGIIEHVNQSGLQLLGGDHEWIVGRPLIAYVESADMRKVLDGVLGGSLGTSGTTEVRLRTRRGPRVVQILARRRGREGDAEGPITFHIALIELTEIRRLEDERRRAEREREESREAERVARAASEAKDQFLAMLSHELRTPLTPILAAAETLMAHDTLSPPLRAKMEIIRRNVKAEARLIDDLLDVARITRNKLDIHCAPTDVHRLLDDVLDGWVAPLAQRDIHLDFRLEASSFWATADAGRLAQVFRNIVNNAAKFTEAGDTITVRTANVGDGIRVTIADSGLGMTDEQLGSLFKPFVQSLEPSPRRGLGLGLVISQAIVEAHEGALRVYSQGPGTGTTVLVDLPTVAAPASEVAPMATGDRQTPSGAKVLLVEDDHDTSDMLSMLLQLEGFEVLTAASLQAARQMADHCAVVVSDIALPDGSGLDLMRYLRDSHPMRGVALSGYGSSRDVQRSLEAGFEEHLTKPVDLERLVAAVRRLTESKE